MQRPNNRLGFTIVELLIVIVVIAILAAISIVVYNGIQNRANAAATETDLSNFEKKLRAYHVVHESFPTSLQAMIDDGFGATDKMNWSDDDYYQSGDSTTRRGQYKVFLANNSSGSNVARLYFWDYTAKKWQKLSISHWILSSGSQWSVNRSNDQLYSGEDSNWQNGCTTELLEDCSYMAL